MPNKKPTKEEQVFLILDAHALIHRAFHALPPFTSPQGEPVGAVYGVASLLFKIVKDFHPTYIAAAFDRPEPTFRHEAYEDYKATRAEISPDIIPQFDKVRELFRAFDVAVYEHPGYEADDVIGTLVEKVKKEKTPTKIIIASGDLDAVQLVDGDKVVVYTMKKGINDTIIYDERAVADRFGFAPELLTDYKGLRGDTSDNIKGVPGIGEKTAAQLVSTYGTLENIYLHIDDIRDGKVFRPSVARVLEEHKKQAFFSRDLATIRTKVPIEFRMNDALWDTYDDDRVQSFLRDLNFTSLLKRLPRGYEEPIESAPHQTPTLFGDTEAALREEKAHHEESADIKQLFSAKKVAYISDDAMEHLYIASEKYACTIPFSDIETQKYKLNTLFADSSRTYISFHAKPIIKRLRREGVLEARVDDDLGIASWVMDPTMRYPHLASLLRQNLRVSVEDADYLTQIRHLFSFAEHVRRELKRAKVESVYRDIEMPLLPVLVRMEEEGIRVDAKALKVFSQTLGASLKRREKKIYALAGTEFNINSPKQLSEVLFTRMGVDEKRMRKTEGGERSTRASELKKLASEYPLAKEVLQYREEAKLKSTYVDALPLLIDAHTGRIHTTFDQTGTVTGRLSSQDPNLQNIPIRTPLGQSIRKAFIADEGYDLVSLDYSQIELRIAASLADDKKMIQAFRDGRDVHTATAAEVNDVPEAEVTPIMRRAAKTINFGILYGMGAVSLAEGLGITRKEAAAFIERYFAHFPNIRKFIDDTKKRAYKLGYVETIFGRRRYFENIDALGWQAKAEAERMAVNAPVQGSEADIVKIAMIKIDEYIQHKHPQGDVRMVLQVHDELLFEIRHAVVREVVHDIRNIMEHIATLTVDLLVEAKQGANWHDMHSIEPST